MTKLLRAGFRRYTHSPITWLGLALSLISGLVTGFMTSSDTYESVYFVFSLLVTASVIVLIIGPEFSDGAFRNKVLAGHSKSEICLSEIAIALCATVVMFLLNSAGFAVFNFRLFEKEPFPVMPYPSMPLIFLGFFLATIASASLTILISLSVSHRAWSPVACLVLIFCIFFASYEIELLLDRPEYSYKIEAPPSMGGIIDVDNLEKEPNPNYIGGKARVALETVYKILPYSHVIEHGNILSRFTYKLNVTLELEEEDLDILQSSPYWLTGVSFVLLAAGYLLFTRKELK